MTEQSISAITGTARLGLSNAAAPNPAPLAAPEREARQGECTSCRTPAEKQRLLACSHFDGQVVCLWYGDEPIVCGPNPEPHWSEEGGYHCRGNTRSFGSLPEAEAEFRRRDELLRAGVVGA